MFNRADFTVAVARNFQDLPHRQVSNQKKYDRKRYMDCKASLKITFV